MIQFDVFACIFPLIVCFFDPATEPLEELEVQDLAALTPCSDRKEATFPHTFCFRSCFYRAIYFWIDLLSHFYCIF